MAALQRKEPSSTNWLKPELEPAPNDRSRHDTDSLDGHASSGNGAKPLAMGIDEEFESSIRAETMRQQQERRCLMQETDESLINLISGSKCRTASGSTSWKGG